MAIKLRVSVLFITLCSFLLPSLSNTNSGDMNWWCNKTPYPKPCFHHLSQQNQSFEPMPKYIFRDLAVQVAMKQALNALNHAKWLGPKCRNEQEKAAWSDCIKLIEITVVQLNQTLDNSNKHTDDEIQTWLSAALTNLDTCQTGFIEQGVTENILPLMFSNNLSELISNTLAINNASITEQTYKKGFPSWLSTSDRRLVQLAETKPNVVVAKDRSGNFGTIKEALDASTKRTDMGRFVIYIKRGVYNEYVQITAEMKNIVMTGDGINNTIIEGNRSQGTNFTTFDSATFSVFGNGFIARGITFRNTAGPENNQAVALLSASDSSVFYQCSFEGYQNTLCVHSNRQFYKECDIYGTIDFIFGYSATVFQNCIMYARTPLPEQKNVVTAHGRMTPDQNTGISIHNSRVVTSFKTYLGRPWKEYSRTVYLQTYLDSLVDPAGWLEWKDDFALNTLYYGEYNNTGPGSSTTGRVKWGGYRVIVGRAEAEKFTVVNFIGGQSWLPNTSVPFTPGL